MLSKALAQNISKVVDFLEYKTDLETNDDSTSVCVSVFSNDVIQMGVTNRVFHDVALFLSEKNLEFQVKFEHFYIQDPLPNDSAARFKIVDIHLPRNPGALFQEIRQKYLTINSVEKISLKEARIKYYPEDCVLEINGKQCRLPVHKNQSDLCKYFFSEPGKKVGESAPCDEVAAVMTGFHVNKVGKEHMRAVQDAMYALNKRVKKEFLTDDNLLGWTSRSLCRNF